MKKKYTLLFILLSYGLFQSCKKEHAPSTPSTPSVDYRANYAGNFKMKYRSYFDQPDSYRHFDSTYYLNFMIYYNKNDIFNDPQFYDRTYPAINFLGVINTSDTIYNSYGIDIYGNLYSYFPINYGGFISKDSIHYKNGNYGADTRCEEFWGKRIK